MRPTFLPQDFFALRDDPYESIRFLVRFAGLAPSSHNTQPWIFEVRDNAVYIRGDRQRALPASDANNRQLFISLGCAIENLLQAIDWYGLPYRVAYFPELDDEFVAARITFDRLVSNHTTLDPNHLAAFIASRHANRSAFEPRPVEQQFIEDAKTFKFPDTHVSFISEPTVRETVVGIVGDATEEAFHDSGFTRELSHWIKPSLGSYRDGMPGYNIGIPWPLSFIVPLAIRYGNVAKQQRTMVEDMLRSAPTFGLIHTTRDTARDWVAAGQMLERIWLTAERSGVRLGVLAAPIQIGEHYQQLQKPFDTDERPQVFFRIGYAQQVPKQSPRLDLTTIAPPETTQPR